MDVEYSGRCLQALCLNPMLDFVCRHLVKLQTGSADKRSNQTGQASAQQGRRPTAVAGALCSAQTQAARP